MSDAAGRGGDGAGAPAPSCSSHHADAAQRAQARRGVRGDVAAAKHVVDGAAAPRARAGAGGHDEVSGGAQVRRGAARVVRLARRRLEPARANARARRARPLRQRLEEGDGDHVLAAEKGLHLRAGTGAARALSERAGAGQR